MSQRRNCQEVIEQMLKLVPSNYLEFIQDLERNYEDAAYKAPEETLQWERTMRTLQKHIPQPTEDWQFQILSIFTTKSVEDLKQLHAPQ